MNEGLMSKNGEQVQNLSYTLCSGLRSLGILKFLLEGDTLALFGCCAESAEIYNSVNRLIKNGMPYDEELYNLSNYQCFFDSLFSKGICETKKIIKYMPVDQSYSDDRVKYNFVRGLIELILSLESDCNTTISVLDELSPLAQDAVIAKLICEALLTKNEKFFEKSMEEYLSFRMHQIEINEEVMVGEECLSIEALALIRMSKEMGMENEFKHVLVPAMFVNKYPDPVSYSSDYKIVIDGSMFNKQYWVQ